MINDNRKQYTRYIKSNSKKSLDKNSMVISLDGQLKLGNRTRIHFFLVRTLLQWWNFIKTVQLFSIKCLCMHVEDQQEKKNRKEKTFHSHLFCLHETYIVFNIEYIHNFYFCLTIWTQNEAASAAQEIDWIYREYICEQIEKKTASQPTKWWKKRRTHEHTTTEHSHTHRS